jgi:hypothetical protein
MSAYRIYFRIQDNIHGRRNFKADDDVTATRIARVLYGACSDVCDGFELWQENAKFTRDSRTVREPTSSI